MESDHYIGVDIGGTKSTVILIDRTGKVAARRQFATTVRTNGYSQTIAEIITIAQDYRRRKKIKAIGVSCGGPLDTGKGLILSPPNLPGWDKVPVVKILKKEFSLPVYLENDANAGALAEWKFGAGAGCNNLVFLTFGTGLGAGLILDGKLYSGSNDLAGEVGHIRIEADGPIGYHKRGSLEGFCSGTGLAQLMSFELVRLVEETGLAATCKKFKAPGEVTGKDVVDWAKQGDPLALSVIEKSGTCLGKGLSILIDLLNPEMIVIGSMGVRLGELLLGPARKVIKQEALTPSARICRIVPAALGEKISDYAALCVALLAEEKMRERL